MWKKSFCKNYTGVQRKDVWHAWVDVNNWPRWDNELEYCDLSSDFSVGNQFNLKPKKGPKVRLCLSEVLPNHKFSVFCKFFGAIMHNEHELEEAPEGVKITNTIRVTGPLAFLWVILVAKNVANAIPDQTDNLIEYLRANHE